MRTTTTTITTITTTRGRSVTGLLSWRVTATETEARVGVEVEALLLNVPLVIACEFHVHLRQ
jgi:hypothetical protein